VNTEEAIERFHTAVKIAGGMESAQFLDDELGQTLPDAEDQRLSQQAAHARQITLRCIEGRLKRLLRLWRKNVICAAPPEPRQPV
jgi:hypothetical protein